MKKGDKIDFSRVAGSVIKVPVETFVEESYLPFAHYVIMSRALISDDGLKPVQRRILYAMDQLGLTDKKPNIKAAQIVGETMGKYHPHGDASIGDALARMGQKFSMRVPLIDVQGSVGSTTGDTPAAPRYWEGRPTRAAMELTRDLKDGAIEIGLNYDGKFAEPAMLPVRWPNGLINGSQGIAVGYSSNIVPHNPTEVMNTLIAMVDNPDMSTEEIMEIMPGPDMPTGGILMNYDAVKDYFNTGKGTFIIRGKYEIIPGARGTHQIIFSEAPYQVSAEQVISAVSKAKEKGRFKEVSQVKDLSDIDNGYRLSIGVKAGANPEVVVKDIFKFTPLEQTFPVNLNVLKYGTPVVSSVKEMLINFLDFRAECVANKTRTRLSLLDAQIERLSGIIAVLVDIDKAISIIRKSDHSEEANSGLQKAFKINEEQAAYILSMPLRRLTKSDSLSIKEEIETLKSEQETLSGILSDESLFKAFLKKEFAETRDIIADERRTVISTKSQADLKLEAEKAKKASELLAKNKEVYVTLFNNGEIVRTLEPYKQTRSAVGIVSSVSIKVQDNLLFVKKDGTALKIPASFIPEEIVNVTLATGAKEGEIVGMGIAEMNKNTAGVLVMSSSGGVNIVNGRIPTGDEFQLTKLAKGEELINAVILSKKEFDENVIVLVTTDGYVTKFPLNQIRMSNSGAGTIRGMILTDDTVKVCGASVVKDTKEAEIISVSVATLKTTLLNEIPLRNRSAKGVILQRLGKGDYILNAFAGEKVVVNKNNKMVRSPEPSPRAALGEKRPGTGTVLGNLQ